MKKSEMLANEHQDMHEDGVHIERSVAVGEAGIPSVMWPYVVEVRMNCRSHTLQHTNSVRHLAYNVLSFRNISRNHVPTPTAPLLRGQARDTSSRLKPSRLS